MTLVFQNDIEQRLFERTLNHPVIGHLVEWVPTQWLVSIANPTPGTVTDLGNWDIEELVDLDTVYAHMLEHGMRDPLLLGVGRVTRTVRLETCNQRIRCLLAHQLSRAPVVAYVGDSAITHIGNGRHEGVPAKLVLPAQPDIMGPYPSKEYRRVSDVLANPPW